MTDEQLEQMPLLVDAQEQLQQEAADPAFYQQDQAVVSDKLQQLADVDQRLAAAYDRWVELAED